MVKRIFIFVGLVLLTFMFKTPLSVFAGTTVHVATIDGTLNAPFGVDYTCGGTGFTNSIALSAFTVDATGSYDFTFTTTSSTGSAFLVIYEDSFDITDTTINCHAGISPTPLTANLTALTSYILVSATNNTTGTGTVTTTIVGPGNICFPSCTQDPVTPFVLSRPSAGFTCSVIVAEPIWGNLYAQTLGSSGEWDEWNGWVVMNFDKGELSFHTHDNQTVETQYLRVVANNDEAQPRYFERIAGGTCIEISDPLAQ